MAFLILILVIHWRLQYVHEHQELSLAVNQMEARAFTEYDTRGGVPGTPEKTVQCMSIMYRVIKYYRSKHNGQYPINPTVLVQDLYDNPRNYGFNNLDDVDKVIKSPDWRFSDKWVLTHDGKPTTVGHPENFVPYLITDKRPDGKPISGPKMPGTRDVLMYTDMYYHVNNHWKTTHDSIQKPVGFFLVLWDDGQVQKVPYNQLQFVPNATSSDANIAFPGQAGVPKTALSYEKYYQRITRT